MIISEAIQAQFPIFDRNNKPVIQYDYSSGTVFLITKPKGWTSFRVVGYLRKLTGVKKVGHAGTLDPMATGLLILCTGKATRSIHHYQDGVKKYLATITFGHSTPSYDAETIPNEFATWDHINESMVLKTIKENFLGDIEQIPPMYSALKHKGIRLYEHARKGIVIDRTPRKVHIFECKLTRYDMPHLDMEITCSKGTYIRSIAHDFGKLLNSRAHLSELVRSSIGDLKNYDALTINDLEKLLIAND